MREKIDPEPLRSNSLVESEELDSKLKEYENEFKAFAEIIKKNDVFAGVFAELQQIYIDKVGHEVEGFTKQQIKEICVPALRFIKDKSDVEDLAEFIYAAANGDEEEPTSTEMRILKEDIIFSKPEELFDGLYEAGIFKRYTSKEFKLDFLQNFTMRECLNSDKKEDFLTLFIRNIEKVENPESGFFDEMKQKFLEMVEDIFYFVLNPGSDQIFDD